MNIPDRLPMLKAGSHHGSLSTPTHRSAESTLGVRFVTVPEHPVGEKEPSVYVLSSGIVVTAWDHRAELVLYNTASVMLDREMVRDLIQSLEGVHDRG